jgi:hypothetical protein
VANGDAGSADARGLLRKKRVAQAAGGVFEGPVVLACIGADVTLRVSERQVEGGGEGLDELEVGGRLPFRTKQVTEVSDAYVELQLRDEAREDDQQRRRVGASGDRDDDALTGFNDVVLADVMEDATLHGRRDASGGERDERRLDLE